MPHRLPYGVRCTCGSSSLPRDDDPTPEGHHDQRNLSGRRLGSAVLGAPAPMTTSSGYESRTVVITGAASGIGAATTRRLAAVGAVVHAVDVAEVSEPVERVHRCDLGDPAAIDALVEELPATVDVLVNCAGVAGGVRFDPLTVFSINFLGLRHLSEALLGRMGPGGAVVHVASIVGNGWAAHTGELQQLSAADSFPAGVDWARARPELLASGYQVSKEAVQHYTQWRSVQTIKRGVRMNSVCPGATETSMMADFRSLAGSRGIDRTVEVGIGRLAQPEEIAPGVVFLASVEASYVNGVNLAIDGGFTAGVATDQVDLDALRSDES